MTTASLGRLTVLAPVPHPTTNFAPIWLVDALGYAAAEGLDYKIELVGTPKAAADGVISGRGDMTFINVVFSLLARDRGAPFCPFYAFVRTQNRSFTVAHDSPIRTLGDLKGKTVGLYYDDPELFEFARAALRGVGLDPTHDIRFITLPGTPLDAARMAAAVRDREVDAIWQLDVLTGFLAGEGVVVRALPSALIDPLTPSSCVEALDRTLAERPDAFGAFGRALAKATLFTITNPAAAIALMWQRYPDAAPRPGEDAARARRRELAALEVRIRGHRIEQAPVPRWGAITAPEIAAWQDFLLSTGAIKQRRSPRAYFSDALVDAFNAFDPAPIIAAARATA